MNLDLRTEQAPESTEGKIQEAASETVTPVDPELGLNIDYVKKKLEFLDGVLVTKLNNIAEGLKLKKATIRQKYRVLAKEETDAAAEEVKADRDKARKDTRRAKKKWEQVLKALEIEEVKAEVGPPSN